MDEQVICGVVFRLLLKTGGPVRAQNVADEVGSEPDEVMEPLDVLLRRGRLRLDATGDIVGCAGLSVVPTCHQIEVDDQIRWTWCALDAIGVLAAVGTPGQITSRDPATGEAVRLRFENGRPTPPDLVITLPERAPGSAVADEWCPMVNFFGGREAAERWMEQQGLSGAVVSVEECVRAGDWWRAILTASP